MTETSTSWKTILIAAALSGSVGVGGGGLLGSSAGAVRAEEKIKIIEEKLEEQKVAIREVDKKTDENTKKLERIDERTEIILDSLKEVKDRL